MILLEIKNLVSGYPHGFHSKPLTLSVLTGEKVGVTGPNGSGKSVFVQTILGLIRPLKGRFVWNKNLKIGFVPQFSEVNRVMPITVDEVLSAACPCPKKSLQKSNDIWQVQKLLRHSFHELSGGQKQKVLITRTLLNKPDVLILDEPTNHMDATSRQIFWSWLADFPAKVVIIVEHDAKELKNVTDKRIEF